MSSRHPEIITARNLTAEMRVREHGRGLLMTCSGRGPLGDQLARAKVEKFTCEATQEMEKAITMDISHCSGVQEGETCNTHSR